MQWEYTGRPFAIVVAPFLKPKSAAKLANVCVYDIVALVVAIVAAADSRSKTVAHALQ